MNNYLDGWERWCTEKFFREVDVVKTELTSQRFRRGDGSGARRGGGGPQFCGVRKETVVSRCTFINL